MTCGIGSWNLHMANGFLHTRVRKSGFLSSCAPSFNLGMLRYMVSIATQVSRYRIKYLRHESEITDI